MAQSKASFLARQSTAKIGLLALGLILASVLIAIYPTISFIRGFTQDSLQPLAEFDSGETLEFKDDAPYSDYLLKMSVDDRNTPVPPMEITIRSSNGPVQGTPTNRWIAIMGREYKEFLVIPKQPDGILTITIETEDNEDFLLYREINDVLERELSRATPFWILSVLPLLIAIALLGIILIRAINTSSSVELHVSE